MTVTEKALPKTGDPHGVLLDVGHGNAAVFFDGETAVVVDAGSGGLVTETLERHGISDISALIVSHRHHDHTSEVPSLLSNRELHIHRLFVNSDAYRNPSSRFEKQLLGAINDSFRRNRTELEQANVTLGPRMGTGRLEVRVLWPDVDTAMRGVGAATDGSDAVLPHEMAVVVRVAYPQGRSVLLCADLDSGGIETLVGDPECDLTADILVYPHHGGLVGAGNAGRERALATALAKAVDPEIVIFSNGRERHGNPRPEVVRGIRSARDSPKIRLVCTQLSKRCSSEPHLDTGRLDATLGSAGAGGGLSCAGSIRVSLTDGPLLPLGQSHVDFVVNTIGEGAMCMGYEAATDKATGVSGDGADETPES